MTGYKGHKIWIEQCEAASAIKERYGTESAFDYVVAEKLAHFVEAAATRPDFAHEPPNFIAPNRETFDHDEIRSHIVNLGATPRRRKPPRSDKLSASRATNLRGSMGGNCSHVQSDCRWSDSCC